MVQLWYYENRGTSCKKILDHVGYPSRVLLFPYEGWAQPALCTYWYLKKPWWSFTKCKIIEIRGHRRIETMGRMVDDGKGGLWVTGKFKNIKEETIVAPPEDDNNVLTANNNTFNNNNNNVNNVNDNGANDGLDVDNGGVLINGAAAVNDNDNDDDDDAGNEFDDFDAVVGGGDVDNDFPSAAATISTATTNAINATNNYANNKIDNAEKNQNKNKLTSSSSSSSSSSSTTMATTSSYPSAATTTCTPTPTTSSSTAGIGIGCGGGSGGGGESREYFRLYLTSNVSTEDFNLGYTMTGTLERGSSKAKEQMQLTHFAMIKRGGL